MFLPDYSGYLCLFVQAAASPSLSLLPLSLSLSLSHTHTLSLSFCVDFLSFPSSPLYCNAADRLTAPFLHSFVDVTPNHDDCTRIE
jgi:hypothetical protein